MVNTFSTLSPISRSDSYIYVLYPSSSLYFMVLSQVYKIYTARGWGDGSDEKMVAAQACKH